MPTPWFSRSSNRGACHTGYYSCFYRRLDDQGWVEEGEKVFRSKQDVLNFLFWSGADCPMLNYRPLRRAAETISKCSRGKRPWRNFSTTALDKAASRSKQSSTPAAKDIIIEKLRDMALLPLAGDAPQKRPQRGGIIRPVLKFLFHRIKTKHVTTFTRQLATLIDAGLPIMRSADYFARAGGAVIFKD